MQYIEKQVTLVLHYVRVEDAPTANSNEDVVALIASFFTQQRGRPVIRGKPQRQQFQRQQSLPRSPIMKKTNSAATMSEEARDQLHQEIKESQGRQWDQSRQQRGVVAVEASQSKRKGE